MSDKERKTLEFMSELRKLLVYFAQASGSQQGCGDLEREPWGGEGWRGTSSQ
jgi:hypothetical protein